MSIFTLSDGGEVIVDPPSIRLQNAKLNIALYFNNLSQAQLYLCNKNVMELIKKYTQECQKVKFLSPHSADSAN